MNLNGIKIMNVEGAEILKNNKEGKELEENYNGIFSDSMLLDQLYKCGLREGKQSTRDIIMVKFGYGYNSKEFKEHENEYKQCKKDIKKYTDKLKEADNEEIQKLLEKALENKAELDELKMDKEEVRNELYINGFKLTYGEKRKKTIIYKFWFRTPSKSRVGDAIFINEKLYDKIIKWQTMGIELQKDKDGKVKKVEIEAYKSLTASHKERYIHIPTSGILVVNDLDSYCETLCDEVYYHIADNSVNADDTEDMCYVRNGNNKVKNTLWDGMMLLDKSICSDNQFCLLRHHFFKACAFDSNIQQFYKDYCADNKLEYDTFTVKDRYGNNILVKNIVAITTENAMKWEKFYDDKTIGYKEWCDAVIENGEMFGVCKVDHKSKYGEYQRSSYQQINSLPINKKQAIQLVKDSKNIIEGYKDDNNKFLEHLQRTATEMNNNAMFIDLYKRNSKFSDTELWRTNKSKALSDYKQQLKGGKLLTIADNLTVCGNPYALLLHSVHALDVYITDGVIEGYKDNTLPILDSGYISCYTTRFEDETLTAFRNPHNSFANILKLKNVRKNNDMMNKYFNFGSNVIAINMIGTDAQERCNSMDEDSDFMYVTNNEVICTAMKDKNYPCIVNKIEKDTRKYEDNNKEMAAIDNALAESKYAIGITSNIAQLALTWYWKDKTQDLKDIVTICSVLAQCAIDNSKRKYMVDLNAEIERIRKLKCMQKTKCINGKEYVAKPFFWQFVKEVKQNEKKYHKVECKDGIIRNCKYGSSTTDKTRQKLEAKNNKDKKKDDIWKHCITQKYCPMDFIQEPIQKIKNDINRKHYADIGQLIVEHKGKGKKEQMDTIKILVKKLDDEYKKQNDLEDDNTNKLNDEEWKEYSLIISDQAIQKISKLNIKEKNIEMLIRDTLNLNTTRPDANNSKYQLKMLNMLYKTHKEDFLNAWVAQKREN